MIMPAILIKYRVRGGPPPLSTNAIGGGRNPAPPEAIKNHRFYKPGNLGSEKVSRQRLTEWWGDRYKRE